MPRMVFCANSRAENLESQFQSFPLKLRSMETDAPAAFAFLAATSVASAAFLDNAGVIPLKCNH